jgi:hypothetical protein
MPLALRSVGVHDFPAADPHVPVLQESHGPLHCSLQQTPLAQKPEEQSEPPLQWLPLANWFGTHFPAMQNRAVEGQFVPWFDAMQLVKHAAPLHAKPPQAVGMGAAHLPPLQVEAAVSIPLEQVCAGHTVPPLPAHPPQFFTSVFESVHVPPQIVIAGGVQPVTQP